MAGRTEVRFAPIHDVQDEVLSSRYWTFISCNG